MSTVHFSGDTFVVTVGNTIGLAVQYISSILLLKAPLEKRRKNDTDSVIRFVSISAKLDIRTVVDLLYKWETC
jgi:hypothetical protein